MQKKNNPIIETVFFIVLKPLNFPTLLGINCYYDTILNLQREEKIEVNKI